jgi:hypothetical protein
LRSDEHTTSTTTALKNACATMIRRIAGRQEECLRAQQAAWTAQS